MPQAPSEHTKLVSTNEFEHPPPIWRRCRGGTRSSAPMAPHQGSADRCGGALAVVRCQGSRGRGEAQLRPSCLSIAGAPAMSVQVWCEVPGIPGPVPRRNDVEPAWLCRGGSGCWCSDGKDLSKVLPDPEEELQNEVREEAPEEGEHHPPKRNRIV